MQSGTQIKTRSTFLTLAGLALAGVLSACGGGSGEVDRIKNDDSAIILPSVNPLNKYIGTYVENRCWYVALTPTTFGSMRFQSAFSASDKPDTLNFASTIFFYDNSSGNNNDPVCDVEIGSSTIFGEIAYAGTLPSVEYANSTKPPLEADKFQLYYTDKLIIKGQVGFGFDELSDYKRDHKKGLIALEGNALYSGDHQFPLDVEGFPTKLNPTSFSAQQ